MLRQSCRSLCCSRPLIRGLSLATASSSSSSSSPALQASSSRPANHPSLRTGPIIMDPRLVHDKSFVPEYPAMPPAMPRAGDTVHAALHPPSTKTPRPAVPPRSVEPSPPPKTRAEATRAAASDPSHQVPLVPLSVEPDGPAADGASALLPEPELEDEQLTVLNKIRQGQSCFFTGAAGTGKSVLLRAIVKALERDGKRVAVTATTGIAARNLGEFARTVHSWSYIGFAESGIDRAQMILDCDDPNVHTRQIEALKRWLETEVLIIDEVSMLDGRTLDMLDEMGRILRGQSNPANLKKPFGGLQMVFAGDFYQLPPVPDAHSAPQFAFDSKGWTSLIRPTGPDMNCYFLRKVHRQGDPRFRALLNRLRVGQTTAEDLKLLMACRRRIHYDDGIEPIKLLSLRESVASHNEAYLDGLAGEERVYPALDCYNPRVLALIKRGKAKWRDVDKLRTYADKSSQLSRTLRLKVGASVMLLKNQHVGEHYLVNGMQGVVELIGTDAITVRFASGLVHKVQQVTEAIDMPDSYMRMTRTQFPLKLAHAITIHKSQGQTLERVVVNARHCWEAGQIYVALSRATSLDGLEIEFLNRKSPGLKANVRVLAFMKNFAEDDTLASS